MDILKLKLKSMRQVAGTLMAVLAAFVMLMMVQTVAVAAPKCGTPPCGKGGGGGSDGDGVDAEYSALITGDVTGASGDNWLGSFGGKSTIGLNSAREGDPGMLNLALFNDGDDFNCFGNADLDLTQVNVKQGGAGNLNGKFFFPAYTNDGETSVLYLLEVFGTEIDGDWPPTAEAPTTTTLTMTDWELSVQNVPKSIKDVSCIGERDPKTDFSIEIKVKREN